MKRDLPKVVYKYARIDQYFYQLIIRGELWFSSPADFNDPFDCNIPWDLFYSYQYNIEQGSLRSSKPYDFFNNFKKCRDNIGICCFSSKKDHLLLWAHYADKHKGISLTFDLDELKKEFSNIKKVIYGNQLPEIDVNVDPKVNFDKYVLKKSPNWNLEKEIRILKDKSGNYKFPKQALKEIRFGTECKKEQAEIIMDLVRNCGYYHVKFTHAFPDKNRYALKTKKYLTIADFQKLAAKLKT